MIKRLLIALAAALALSQPVMAGGISIPAPAILLAQGTGASVTGTASETALATITVPANAMGANGCLEITTLWALTNNADTKTLRVRFSGVSGIQYFSPNASSVASYVTLQRICNANATNAQVASPLQAYYGSSTSAVTATGTVDTTAATTIVISAQLGTTTDTVTLKTYSVKLYSHP